MKSAAMSAFPYRTQAVRDLAWACFAPPLLQVEQLADDGQNVASCGLDLNVDRRRWLEQLDREPAPLLDYLGQSDCPRLGIYFERLWHYFLSRDESVELVAHNLPVRDGQLTLGEFDVIYWCHERRRHFHLELAVKFFLGHRLTTTCEPVSRWHEWLGPNTDDRLDLKVEQLLQRQIRLGERPSAREQLKPLGIVELAQEIAFKGYLFQPLLDPLPAPFAFNSQLALSHWLALTDLERYLQGLEAERFLPLPKARWLAPAQPGPGEILFSRVELAQRLHSLLDADRRARLVAGFAPDGKERYRFFVTTDAWPTGLH